MLKIGLNLLCLSAALPVLCGLATQPVIAQNGGTAAIPSSEQPGARELRFALQRIGRNRRNVDALIDAGNASLLLEDTDAALNFFRRAESLRPSDGRIQAGIGAALVRQENPFEALQYFDAATRLGVSPRVIALDRGLAFDLLGNFARAQQDYVLAGTGLRSDLLTIRHAISLSLSGKAKESDELLTPLLTKNSPAAWRARAFILAARGDFRASREVARGFLNVRTAQRVEPFLRRMPDLTPAQQAAAIHLGHFPARNIGKDNPRIGIAAASIPAPGSLPGAVRVNGSDRLKPAGRPLGAPPTVPTQPPSIAQLLIAEAAAASQNVAAKAPALSAPKPAAPSVATVGARPVAVAPSAPLPTSITPKRILPAPVQTIETLPVAKKPAGTSPAPAVAAAVVAPKAAAKSPGFDSLSASKVVAAPSAAPTPPAPKPAPSPVAVAAKQTAPVPKQPAPIASVPAPVQPETIFKPSSATTNPVRKAAAAPKPAAAVATGATTEPQNLSQPQPTPQSKAKPPVTADNFDLGDIVKSIDIPETEKQRRVQPVDLATLPKPEPRAAPQAAPKPQPAASKAADPNISTDPRYWVQIATGPMSAHRGEYRRLSRKYPDLFKGREGWSSAWNNTGRLVVGPFEGFTPAKEWYEALKEAGGDGFVWNSAKGTKIIRLKRK